MLGEGVVDRIVRGLLLTLILYSSTVLYCNGESVRISWLDPLNRLYDVIGTNSLLFCFHRTNLISLVF